MAKYKILVGTELTDATAKISRASKALSDLTQSVLVGATFHAIMHGNTEPINALIEAMGRGMRKTAAAQWLLTHAPVVPEDNKEKAKVQPFRFSRDKVEELCGEAKPDEATATEYAQEVARSHWTEHKEPPLVPDSYDVVAELNKLVKKAGSMAEKGVEVTGMEMLERLHSMLAAATPGVEVASLETEADPLAE